MDQTIGSLDELSFFFADLGIRTARASYRGVTFGVHYAGKSAPALAMVLGFSPDRCRQGIFVQVTLPTPLPAGIRLTSRQDTTDSPDPLEAHFVWTAPSVESVRGALGEELLGHLARLSRRYSVGVTSDAIAFGPLMAPPKECATLLDDLISIVETRRPVSDSDQLDNQQLPPDAQPGPAGESAGETSAQVHPAAGAPNVAVAAAPSETNDPMVAFQRQLRQSTPRVYVTWILLGLNVAAFILTATLGAAKNAVEPTAEDLVRWGANFGGRTPLGEWWRLLTCMFIHIGPVHLALNMWVLVRAGPLVERLVGNAGFTAAYILSGLIGALSSLWMNPQVVSAGASGAIFGVYGVLIGVLSRRRGEVPLGVLHGLRNSGVGFVGYNLIYNLTQPNVDMAAHVGGLIGGLACGLLLAGAVSLNQPPRRAASVALLVGVGSAAVAVVLLLVPFHFAAAERQINQARAVESRCLDAYNAAVKRLEAKEITPAQLAEVVEKQVIPPWRTMRDRISPSTAGSVEPLREHLEKLKRYVTISQEVWELTARYLRTDNPDVLKELEWKRRERDEVSRLMQ
jgi:rhomboid protease GluP